MRNCIGQTEAELSVRGSAGVGDPQAAPAVPGLRDEALLAPAAAVVKKSIFNERTRNVL